MNHESFFIENVTRANFPRNGVFEAVPSPAPGEGARGSGRVRVAQGSKTLLAAPPSPFPRWARAPSLSRGGRGAPDVVAPPSRRERE
ncbi:hypothetical protein DS837_15705 [Azospirillum brasilense]|uniref:Uncharacterized protein n=1 Tax=Azospirillum brasilense TaxID=192 RepID=A0A6L3AZW2_AZOBR|nr:hypothetical protein DS837_15705 [Azospirillum brasilense]